MHEHLPTCQHLNLKYCPICGAVYCADCGQEWFYRTLYWSYTYPYPIVYNGVTLGYECGDTIESGQHHHTG